MQPFLIFITQSLIVFLGISAQKLVLEKSYQLTPCTEHLRSEIDSYVVTVRLGDNRTHLLSKGWKHFVTIQMSKNTVSPFQNVCQILLNASSCDNRLVSKCRCYRRNIPARVETMFVHVPAPAIYSQGFVRGVWEHRIGTYVYSNVLSLPTILDVAAAVLNLTVTATNVSVTKQVTEDQCFRDLVPDVQNTLMLCCNRTALPCYPYIQLGEFIVTNNNSPCSSYIFTPEPGFTSNAVISYSVCSQKESIIKSNCTLVAGGKFHKYFRFIPPGFYFLSAGLGCCWLIVIILYLVLKIFRPWQEQRRNRAKLSPGKDDEVERSLDVNTTSSDPTQDKRINSLAVGDQVSEMNHENVDVGSDVDVQTNSTGSPAAAPHVIHTRFDLNTGPDLPPH